MVDRAEEQDVSRAKGSLRGVVSILRGLTTTLLGIRCIFEIDSIWMLKLA